MFLFKKKPACKDLGYVVNIRSALKNSYQEEYITQTIIKDREINDFNDLEKIIVEISVFFNVKIVFEQIAAIDEEFDNLPVIFEVIQDFNRNVIIGVTPFGYSSLNVLFCEMLLFLTDHKITNDGYIEFEDEFFSNYEDAYRPFLALSAVYFGFGHFLLKRFWVSGVYSESHNSEKVLEYKYYIPLDVNYLIFALCYEEHFKNKNENHLLELTRDCSKEIKKEMDICLSFIEKNINTISMSHSENSFFWKRK